MTRTTTQQLSLAALTALTALSLGAVPLLAGRPAPAPTGERELYSAYYAQFKGRGTEGRQLVWHGAIAGAAIGEFTVLLTHTGKASSQQRGPQPVEGTIMVVGEDPTRAFAAEVQGTIDWQARRLDVAGEVTTGYRRGMALTQTAELVDTERIAHNLSGELRFGSAAIAGTR